MNPVGGQQLHYTFTGLSKTPTTKAASHFVSLYPLSKQKKLIQGYPAVAFTAPATTILLPQPQINAPPKAVILCEFCHFQ